MFFHIQLDKNIVMEARHFGKNLRELLLEKLKTDVNKFGFFAEAGPLNMFVSNQLITEDMAFESVGENAYVSADQEVRIVKDAEVRVRVVGMRIDASEIFW